jgi:hypothetical protein
MIVSFYQLDRTEGAPMTSNDTRVDIFSAAERAKHLATSLERIVALIAEPVAATAEGEAVSAVEAVAILKGEAIDAAFEAREQRTPFTAEDAVAALIDRMHDLYLVAGGIEMLASDVAMHLGAEAFDEQ